MANITLKPLVNHGEDGARSLSATIVEKDEGIDDGFIRPHENPETNLAAKPGGRRQLDINLYATKKTIAQGMMDLALLTANSNQLSYVLRSAVRDSYFFICVSLISLSIALQITVAIGLVFLGRYNVKSSSKKNVADRLNNWVTLGILLITVLNIFISAFPLNSQEELDPALIIEAYQERIKLQQSEAETI